MANGACERCGGSARVFIDGKEFCSMGCSKAAQDSPRPEREVRVGKGKEKK